MSELKPCRLKQYEVWACRPAPYTYVINKLERPDIINTVKEANYLGKYQKYILATHTIPYVILKNIQKKFSSFADYIDKNCEHTGEWGYVISGTRGEKQILKIPQNTGGIINYFEVFDGNRYIVLTDTYIKNKTLPYYDKGGALDDRNMGKEVSIVPWMKLRYVYEGGLKSKRLGMYHPASKGQQAYIEVFRSSNGKPSGIYEGSSERVPLEIFKDKYDNRGWSTYLRGISEYELSKPNIIWDKRNVNRTEESDYEVNTPVSYTGLQLPPVCSEREMEKIYDLKQKEGIKSVPPKYVKNFIYLLKKHRDTKGLKQLEADLKNIWTARGAKNIVNLTDYLNIIVDDCLNEKWKFKYLGLWTKGVEPVARLELTYGVRLKKDAKLTAKVTGYIDVSLESKRVFVELNTSSGVTEFELKSYDLLRPHLYCLIFSEYNIEKYLDESGNSILLQ